jgi:hypothetical protein
VFHRYSTGYFTGTLLGAQLVFYWVFHGKSNGHSTGTLLGTSQALYWALHWVLLGKYDLIEVGHDPPQKYPLSTAHFPPQANLKFKSVWSHGSPPVCRLIASGGFNLYVAGVPQRERETHEMRRIAGGVCWA